MRFAFAVIISRILWRVGRLIGKGTAKPGEIARVICPNILKRLKFKGKVICVTGTNGKTTTSNLITHILRKNGFSVINNSFGSNMLGGITTALLNECSFKGKVDADFSVLEIDERWLRFLVKEVKPDYLLITNLLRDQIVRNCCPEIVLGKINLGITEGTTLVLNANDPVSMQASWGRDNPVVWFSLGKNERSTETCVSGTNDARVCPKCFRSLSYDFYHYNHIGSFHCENCGFECPTANYAGDNIDYETASMDINGIRVKMGFNATYFLFNTVAASAVCCEASGLPLEKVLAAAESFDIGVIGRYEEMTVLGRKVLFVLTKQNPASVDQSVDFAAGMGSPTTAVIIADNMFHTDRRDVLFMYDVAYENLRGVEYIIICGKRRYDMAVRLKLAGIDMARVQICDDEEKIGENLRKTEGEICFLTLLHNDRNDKLAEGLKKL